MRSLQVVVKFGHCVYRDTGQTSGYVPASTVPPLAPQSSRVYVACIPAISYIAILVCRFELLFLFIYLHSDCQPLVETPISPRVTAHHQNLS